MLKSRETRYFFRGHICQLVCIILVYTVNWPEDLHLQHNIYWGMKYMLFPFFKEFQMGIFCFTASYYLKERETAFIIEVTWEIIPHHCNPSLLIFTKHILLVTELHVKLSSVLIIILCVWFHFMNHVFMHKFLCMILVSIFSSGQCTCVILLLQNIWWNYMYRYKHWRTVSVPVMLYIATSYTGFEVRK
jgi:hypothetical protein